MPKQKSIPVGVNHATETGAVHLPAADEEFWRRTDAYMPKTKQGVFIRLDADVLAWLKGKGKGYQTRMNAMLRVLMESDGTAAAMRRIEVLALGSAPSPVVEMAAPAKRRRPRIVQAS